MQSSKKNGRIWPYAIGIAITLVFGACIATVVVSSSLPVQQSDTYMMDYQTADANANEIILSAIRFSKKYNVEYIPSEFNLKGNSFSFKVTDKSGKAVNDAKLVLMLTRLHAKSDINLDKPVVKDGVYSFENIDVPLKGRWIVKLRVEIGNDVKYLDYEADTRSKDVIPYAHG